MKQLIDSAIDIDITCIRAISHADADMVCIARRNAHTYTHITACTVGHGTFLLCRLGGGVVVGC